ncbi:hypothetical protein EYC84_010758 [Monilinia fructicola]|uniref:Uncharacterized protein n=1 Tax=Monilinia fructicola TaxID=38448 RepID=A0A5M9JAS2_MONFR|nr:hypothetical protein EYC84_010758 [Monilinia fructicola]
MLRLPGAARTGDQGFLLRSFDGDGIGGISHRYGGGGLCSWCARRPISALSQSFEDCGVRAGVEDDNPEFNDLDDFDEVRDNKIEEIVRDFGNQMMLDDDDELKYEVYWHLAYMEGTKRRLLYASTDGVQSAYGGRSGSERDVEESCALKKLT